MQLFALEWSPALAGVCALATSDNGVRLLSVEVDAAGSTSVRVIKAVQVDALSSMLYALCLLVDSLILSCLDFLHYNEFKSNYSRALTQEQWKLLNFRLKRSQKLRPKYSVIKKLIFDFSGNLLYM